MMTMADTFDTQNRNLASTFAKGMAVLEAFDGHSPSLTLAEIARATGQDRATARRGALTLLDLGYLRQEDRQFILTPKVLCLAGGFLQAQGFGRLVQPVLNRHAAAMGSELSLATRDKRQVLLLAQSTVTHGPISHGFTAGSHLPLLHTSLGRMLLACLPAEDAARIVAETDIPRPTAQALDTTDAILDRIEIARTGGFAVTDSEFEPGIIGLAVPVNGPGSTPVVLGSSIPRGRDGARSADPILEGLQRCASELRQTGVLARL